jgi:hypothetical protein
VLTIFLRMFAVGGIALLALLWFGSFDDDGLAVDGSSGFASAAAALLSIRGILAAITTAGLLGALALGVLKLPQPAALVFAGAGAVAGFRSWRALLRKLRYFDRDHSAAPELLLGREGVLTVGAQGADAPGVVQVTLGGVSQEYSAIPEDQTALEQGARVMIVRIVSPSQVIVGATPFPSLPPNP